MPRVTYLGEVCLSDLAIFKSAKSILKLSLNDFFNNNKKMKGTHKNKITDIYKKKEGEMFWGWCCGVVGTCHL